MKPKTTKQHLKELYNIVEKEWSIEFTRIYKHYREDMIDYDTPPYKMDRTEELKDLDRKLEIISFFYNATPDLTQNELDSGLFEEDEEK